MEQTWISTPWVQGFVGLATAYATWWTWSFILRPAIYTQEPKQYPYLIPFIGHAIAFSKDMNRTFSGAREYFGDTRSPFAVTVAGQVFYIITSPEDTNLVYRNVKTLTFDEFIEDTLKGLGVSDEGVRKSFPQGPGARSLASYAQELYRIQFLTGERAVDFWASVYGSIDKSMHLSAIPAQSIVQKSARLHRLSLWKWTRTTLIEAITRGLYGDVLFEIEPNLVEIFTTFDDNSWKLLHKYPKYAAKEVYTSIDQLCAMFEKYLDLPDSKRTGRAWVLKELENKFREFGLTGRDLAVCLIMPFWVSNSNGYKLCFWVLSFLLQDQKLLAKVRDETRGITDLDPGTAGARLEQCRELVAVYNEVLRLVVSTASIRGIAADTAIGEVILKAGNKVMIPYRQLHMHEGVWGPDFNTFKHSRFADSKSDLTKSPSFRPFGGGNTLCTGRHVAMREVLAFVAFAIHRLNIDLPEGAERSVDKIVAMIDQAMPTLGVLLPLPGQDVEVSIS